MVLVGLERRQARQLVALGFRFDAEDVLDVFVLPSTMSCSMR
jgi:hypothetical protein